MSIIEPTRTDIDHPNQIKKYSSSLRLWHWANAVVITGSLLTVLVNSTILDDKSTATFIKNGLQKTGSIVSSKQAQSVAHAMSDNVWDIHKYFGFGLVALL